jgi:hypothetical protein
MEELVAQLVEHSAFNRLVLGSSPSQLNMSLSLFYSLRMKMRIVARIAQSVEQRTENPRVASSNLAPGICKGFPTFFLGVPFFYLFISL